MNQALTLESLSKIDNGRIATAVNQALRRATDDCRDRPGQSAARKVVVTLTITPKPDEDSDPEAEFLLTEVDFAVTEKYPARKSKPFSMAATRKGQLVFNDMSPDDARQGTFDDPGGLRRVAGANE